MVAVEVLGLNPDNGSNFDVILLMLVVPLLLVLYAWHRWRARREHRRAREERRMDMKALIEHTPSHMSFRLPEGVVFDQGSEGSSVGMATAHEFAVVTKPGVVTDEDELHVALEGPVLIGTPWHEAKSEGGWKSVFDDQEGKHADQ